MKRIVGLMMVIALMLLPSYAVNAQVPIDRQIMEAADDLDSDARLEFIALIRDPGEWEGAFEELGVTPELADRIDDRISSWGEEHQIDQAFKKLETIDDKIERKLANIKDHQIGKAEKTLEKAFKKIDKVLVKVEKKEAKAEEKVKDKAKDPAPEPDPAPDPAPDPEPDPKDKDKDKKDKDK